MENPNKSITTTTTTTEESNNENSASAAVESGSTTTTTTTRTPFSDLSQVDADLVLARTLQEQERAYMMLRINGEGGGSISDYGGSSDAGSFLQEDEDEDDDEDFHDDDSNDDAFDAQHENLENPHHSDEAFARALQDAEDRELAARMMALTAATWDQQHSDDDDNDTNSQDTWEEVDPDELSYEELLALGDVVGTESRGLSADTIASLPSMSYKSQGNEDSSTDQCVICRLEYEDEDTLTVLSCKHMYHSECINNWLHINKVCPICSAEVSTSDKREEGSPVP